VVNGPGVNRILSFQVEIVGFISMVLLICEGLLFEISEA